MELGPHAGDVLDIVDVVESGVIFRHPRPPLDPDVIVINDMAKAGNYRFTDPDVREGRVWEWRELLDFAGEPYSRRDIDEKHDDVLDSFPDLLDNLIKLMEERIGPSLDLQFGSKYTENDIIHMYGNLDFIISFRATFGRTLPFIERLVAIYRLGGHPCGWSGPYPEGRLVAYFPPGDGALEHAPRTEQ